MTDPGERDIHGEAHLDGLAGRVGHGPAHDEGRQLRDALESAPPCVPPAWSEIERRAENLDAASPVPALVSAKTERPEAANANQWRRWYGAAAVLVMGLGIASSIWLSKPEAVLRGLDRTSHKADTVAEWRVPNPTIAARNLATELQAMGAKVEIHAEEGGAWLQISAPPEVIATVNQRLSSLETALDAKGQLRLRVLER